MTKDNDNGNRITTILVVKEEGTHVSVDLALSSCSVGLAVVEEGEEWKR